MAEPNDPPQDRRLSPDALTILMAEWSHCEVGIARYDTLQFQVRGWTISLVAALLAAAVTLQMREVALIGIFVAALFWWIEALHDSYQGVIIRRVHVLQRLMRAHIRGKVRPGVLATPMTAQCFTNAWNMPFGRKAKEILRRAFYINVLVTYLCLMLVCVACFVVLSPSAPDASRDINNAAKAR